MEEVRLFNPIHVTARNIRQQMKLPRNPGTKKKPPTEGGREGQSKTWPYWRD